MAGKVVCDDARIDSPALKVPEDAALRLKGMRTHNWASRGGLKLEHAIEAFGVDVAGAVAIDVGCSTGGFTDVLIAKGAAKARPPCAPPLAGYPRRAARARTPRFHETCPVSTGEGTRRVQSVREGGGGGGRGMHPLKPASPLPERRFHPEQGGAECAPPPPLVLIGHASSHPPY